MTRSRVWTLVALAVVAALAVVGSVVTPTGRTAHAARARLAPVVASQLVCSALYGGPAGRTTDMTVGHVTQGAAPTSSYRPEFGPPPPSRAVPLVLRPSTVVHKATAYGAVTVNSSGLGADGVVASQTSIIPNSLGRGLLDQTCLPPGTDWWFAGADGRVGIEDLLLLVNPGDAPANVAITFWTRHGPVNPPGASGIVLAPHSTLVRSVSAFTPDVPAVAFRVHANSGTVSATVLDEESAGVLGRGSDWLPPTAPPSTSSVVTGFMTGARYARLDLANPGAGDATVSLRILTPTKNFVPAGHQTVVVRAGTTTRVDLSGPIAGEAAAVVIGSDTPVIAAGLTARPPTQEFGELAWLPAQLPSKNPAGIGGNAPPFGQFVGLMVTAPAAAATVRVTRATGASVEIRVAAGRTVNVNLAALLHVGGDGPGPLLFTSQGGPVCIVRQFYAVGAHGPLMSVSAPMVLPSATVLPPVVADLRAALP